MAEQLENTATLIGLGSSGGHAVVNKHSPLRRLNYFDGKFIRAPDLILEQQALLNQMRLGNRAGGAGVVYGFDCSLAGDDSLAIGAGYAIDPEGKALLLPEAINIAVAELIEKSNKSALEALSINQSASSFSSKNTAASFDDCVLTTGEPGVTVGDANQFYVITVNHTEAYCGEEDVYGKLCSEACSTSTNRSYIIEGIEIRALSIDLSQLFKTSSAYALSATHLRSRVASAFYEQERQQIAAHISASGLASNIWCLGAEAASGNGVPIALLARNGSATLFLDAWTARRERMESPPRNYWAQRMAMRPWAVFLAQVLQFQCQLKHCFASSATKDPGIKITDFDPCSDTRKIAGEAAQGMRFLMDSLGSVATRLADINTDFDFTELQARGAQLELQYQQLFDASQVTIEDRLLLNCGLVELPSAGYLPVNVSSTITVNEQIRRMMGEGVDIRFCVTHADYIPEALQQAQHMERICLLSGLDDPSQKPKVDVLVPEGFMEALQTEVNGIGYQSTTAISNLVVLLGLNNDSVQKTSSQNQLRNNLNRAATADVVEALPSVMGAARGEQLDNQGFAFHLAARTASNIDLSGSGNLSLRGARVNAESILSSVAREALIDSIASAALNDIGDGIVETRFSTTAAAASAIAPTILVWATLKIDNDPFSMAAGASCDFSARFVLVYQAEIGDDNLTLTVERNINGRLVIEKSASREVDTQLTARLEGNGVWQDVRNFRGEKTERLEAIKFNDSLTIARNRIAGLPPSVTIVMNSPSFLGGLDNVQLVAERFWSSTTESVFRLRLKIKLADLAGNDIADNLKDYDQLLLQCNLLEDENVLAAGNRYHGASLTALDGIEKSLTEKGFSNSAQQSLFPPAQAVPDELRVLARRDWVLFHRRREKTCANDVAPEVHAPARQYRVYHVHLDPQITLDRLLEMLGSDLSGTLAGLDPRAVTTVEFAPSVANVVTAHGDVQADWQARVQAAADLQFAVIASEGDVLDEGAALANSRLSSLTNVLAPVSELADSYQTLNLNQVPGNLASAQVDGVVVYFTRAVAAICHKVFRLQTRDSDELLKTFEAYISNPSQLSLAGIVKQYKGESLSVDARFLQGAETFYGSNQAAQLAAAWGILGAGPVHGAIALADDENDSEQLISRQQTEKITQTVGSALASDAFRHYLPPADIQHDCDKTTVLVSVTECHSAIVFVTQRGELDNITQDLVKHIESVGLTPEMISGNAANSTVFTPLAEVDFYKDSDDFESKSRADYSAAWQSELNGSSPRAISAAMLAVARGADNDADTAANLNLAAQQAFALRSLMGLDHVPVQAVTNARFDPNGDQVEFPVSCRAMTLLIVGGIRDLSAITHVTAVAIGNNSNGADGAGLNLAAAGGLRFDDNSKLIRNAEYDALLERLRAADITIKSIELVSMDGATDSAAHRRATTLLSALRESGVAGDSAVVSVREANVHERLEIIRSGFVLNRGLVLR